MIQVDLIRGRILRALREVRIYISCLSEREETALQRLHGQEGLDRCGRIADYILDELGHEVTLPEEARFSKSRRAASEATERSKEPRLADLGAPAIKKARAEGKLPPPKKRGRPAKVNTQAEPA